MTEALSLAWAFGTGLVLGAVFFGGLWWTVRKVSTCQRPAVLFLGSFLLRTSIALAGLYFVAGGHWHRLLACLLGFVLARLLVTKLAEPSLALRRSPGKEGGHAS